MTDENNPEKVRASKAEYVGRYPERVKAHRAQMLAERRGAFGVVTEAQWTRVLAHYGYRCAECEATESLTMDHFVPIILGGTHTWDNVWPLCLPCNLRKGTRVPKEPGPPHAIEFLLAA